MTMADSTYSLAPDVVVFPVDDGSARVLDPDGGVFALSETAATMLRDILADGVETTVARTAARYDIAAERVRIDLDALIRSLLREGVIESARAPSRRKAVKRFLARATMRSLLGLCGRVCRSDRSAVAAVMACARLGTAIFGWGPVVDAVGRAVPAERSHAACDPDLIRRFDEMVRTASASLPTAACKERALTCWYLLRSRGVPATLVVGLQLFPLAGHCWVEVEEQVLTDAPERCATFTPILRYPSEPLEPLC